MKDKDINGVKSEASMMRPPSTKRQNSETLSAEMNYGSVVENNVRGTKRKRSELMTENTLTTPKPAQINHRRSHTTGDVIMSAPPHGLLQSQYKSRLDFSKVPQGSMLNDILMKQARRLAPTTKSDTTHTDYFRLKALGVDPDTPIVPATKKRLRVDSNVSESSKSQRPSQSASPSPLKLQSHAATPSASDSGAKDDDAELFAQLRSVREALAESEQWMQSERQSIERSASATSQQPSHSPPSIETPAQRRLRDIKERGHQPSRTELRLRAMGDKALLPKGFWDREGMGKSLSHRMRREHEGVAPRTPEWNGQVKTNGVIGFAAIEQGNPAFEGGGGMGMGSGEMAKKGASVEDAIEL